MNIKLYKELLINSLWSVGGRFGYIIIGLISNLILVRFLEPKEFGQMAIIMFFIIVASVLSDSGLGGALIRKKEVSEIDYSTIFVFNFIVSLIIMFIFIGISGWVSQYYKDSDLKYLLIIASLVLIINALKVTQATKLIKDMRFKEKALYEFISIVIGASVAIFLAIKNFGVWALVGLQLVTALSLTIILWITIEPITSIRFSQKSFKEFFGFGINTTLASLLNTIFNNIYQLVIGKYFSILQVGYYYQARQLQEIPIGIVQSTVMNVIYAGLSKYTNKYEFDSYYQNTIKIFSIATGLIFILLYIYADVLVTILYGNKWISVVGYLKILALVGYFSLHEMFNRTIFKIFNRTEKILQLEVLKKIIQSITIVYGLLLQDIEVLLIGLLLTNIISYFLNCYYSKKIQGLFNYQDLKVSLIVLLISFFVIFIFGEIIVLCNVSQIYKIALLPFILLLYILLIFFSKLLKVEDFKKIKNLF